MSAVAAPAPVRDTLHAQGLEVDIALAAGTLHAVRGVDLHVARGETLCIVGESGCGKSMTALALMGLLPESARAAGSIDRPGSNQRLHAVDERVVGRKPAALDDEDLLFMLNGMGVQTGADLDAVLRAGEAICGALGRVPGSKVARARSA